MLRIYLGHRVRKKIYVSVLKYHILYLLATVCHFTKILKPINKQWYSHGLRVIIYLVDGIVVAQGKDEAVATNRKK